MRELVSACVHECVSACVMVCVFVCVRVCEYGGACVCLSAWEERFLIQLRQRLNWCWFCSGQTWTQTGLEEPTAIFALSNTPTSDERSEMY